MAGRSLTLYVGVTERACSIAVWVSCVRSKDQLACDAEEPAGGGARRGFAAADSVSTLDSSGTKGSKAILSGVNCRSGKGGGDGDGGGEGAELEGTCPIAGERPSVRQSGVMGVGVHRVALPTQQSSTASMG